VEVIVGLLLTGLAVYWAFSKGAQLKDAQREINRMEQIVKGQDAALKLKREQERLRDEEAKQRDLVEAEALRRAADSRRIAGFLRDSFGPKRPSEPGGDPVLSPEAPGPSDDKPE
jgi:hypothetical protein